MIRIHDEASGKEYTLEAKHLKIILQEAKTIMSLKRSTLIPDAGAAYEHIRDMSGTFDLGVK